VNEPNSMHTYTTQHPNGQAFKLSSPSPPACSFPPQHLPVNKTPIRAPQILKHHLAIPPHLHPSMHCGNLRVLGQTNAIILHLFPRRPPHDKLFPCLALDQFESTAGIRALFDDQDNGLVRGGDGWDTGGCCCGCGGGWLGVGVSGGGGACGGRGGIGTAGAGAAAGGWLCCGGGLC
jgi:hypothetical protein